MVRTQKQLKMGLGGTWVAQSVGHLTLAQDMISGSWDRALSWALYSEGASTSPSASGPLPDSCLFLPQIHILKRGGGGENGSGTPLIKLGWEFVRNVTNKWMCLIY